MAFRKIINDGEGGQKYVTEQEEELVFDQVPTEGSFNPVTSDGIFAAIQQMAQETEEAVNEDLEARKFKVIAKALCELKATLDGVVEAVTSENIGTRTADSLDVQELLIGGTVFDPSELNNTKSVSVTNSDIRKSISESSDELEATEETETETKEVFGKTSADKNEK
jgi:hypothetical protein